MKNEAIYFYKWLNHFSRKKKEECYLRVRTFLIKSL